MKKLFFTLALILGVFAVNAQNVGQMWVGGSVGLWSSKVKGEDSQTSYKILPEFGYVFSENLGVGINVGYAHMEGKAANIGGTYYNSDDADGFIVAPFIRYTFLKGNIGGLFLDGGVGYTHLKEKYTNALGEKDDVKVNMFEVGIKPGVAISVSEKVSLTGKIGFIGYQYEKAGEAKTNSFGLDIDLSRVELGASIVF